jgi:hypothetical protein
MHVVILAALGFGVAILSHTAQAPPTTPIVVQADRGAIALVRATREPTGKAR